MQRIGVHVSIAGGIDKAPERAKALGCNTFQFFSRPPRGGPRPMISLEVAEFFKKKCAEYDLQPTFIHTPYFIHLASPNPKNYAASVQVLAEEMEVGSLLGAKVVTHLGSAGTDSMEDAVKRVIRGLEEIFTKGPFDTEFIIEMSAGSGNVVGDRFEEIALILEEWERKSGRPHLGVGFDTQHAFASGYDIRTTEGFKKTVDEFDELIGLEHLKLIHVNDSKVPLGKRSDRHEGLGKGFIGLEAFRALMNHPQLKNVPKILETPGETDADDLRNLRILRELIE